MAYIDGAGFTKLKPLRMAAAGVAAVYGVAILSPNNGVREPSQAVVLQFIVSSTTGFNVDVQVEVAEDETFTSIVWSNTLPALESGHTEVVASGLLDGTQYFWRVRAAEAGTTGWTEWTETRFFYVDLDAGKGFAYSFVNVGTEPNTVDPDPISYTYLNQGILDLPEPTAFAYVYGNAGLPATTSSAGIAYVYMGDVDDSTPTPHIWFLRPAAGRPGDGIRVIGFGFGDTPTQYNGVLEMLLNGEWVGVDVTAWQTYPASPDAYTDDRMIDVITGLTVDPQHTEIEFVIASYLIPPGVSVRVRTDGP